MFRVLARMLMIVVACLALVAVAGIARAATGANPLAWMASDSGTGAPQIGLAATSPNGGPADAPSGGPSATNDGDGDTTSSAESAAEDAQDTQDSAQSSDQAQEQELSGVVASVDAANSAFTLTTASGPVTVAVSSATQYDDGLSALSSLQSGMTVTVDGTAQTPGQTLASEVKGSNDASANGASANDTGSNDASAPDAPDTSGPGSGQ